jgi:hypothetical protein
VSGILELVRQVHHTDHRSTNGGDMTNVTWTTRFTVSWQSLLVFLFISFTYIPLALPRLARCPRPVHPHPSYRSNRLDTLLIRLTRC